ncbi:heparinase II/III family protein [uncultured Polaribacter sp.]|uniref:heparinase II/III domain-containing protein n=1 Tax=uncultured Polaribacter sp. TaxID=174711 RepID=UPI0026210F0E|nr:heparinase II/III family protein [uncultured Polaribacter sp.]
MKLKSILLFTAVFIGFQTFCQELERPFILVTSEERPQILEKIKTQDWAQETFTELKTNTDVEVKKFYKNPNKYLKQLPFNWKKQSKKEFPPFYKTDHLENGKHKNLDNATDKEWKPAELLIKYLQIALDCSQLYYLTQDEKYGYVASSILYSFTKSVQKSKLSDWHSRGGWLFPYDGFREVRVIGYKVPLIYDFIHPYLIKGGKSLDIIQNKKVSFPIDELQNVCRTYADITINYGHTGSNHSVLEAPSLVYNALAMDDKNEREKLLSYFLTKNTKNQDALNVMAKNYKNKGDIWPETSQYLNHSTAILAKLMLVVNRYNPSLKLSKQYPNILYALPRLDFFKYPNNEIIRWGDGKRKGIAPYQAIDYAYNLAKMDGSKELSYKLGSVLKRVQQDKKYKRTGIESVFWLSNDINIQANEFTLPRTDRVYHAGIVLQRNISETKNLKDGLMAFVGGAHMVHGHAEGMNMELYGEGQVLGVDNGRGRYAKDIHENYSRIFAAHNTVIVNGASQGEGKWANLGINKVEVVSMEPKVGEKGVSSYYSFSQTSFDDIGGDKAEAKQQRTLGLIRTSPTTGYYIDVFRSKSKLPNEFHDYLYHNIGDKLKFLNKDLKFNNTPERFAASANKTWKKGQYRNPGWHFFKKVKTSQFYDNTVKAAFQINKLQGEKLFMQLHIPGFKNREYSRVMAPHTFEAPKPYHKLPTPTLVIRNKGEAWKKPFVVIYEPFNNKEEPTISSVEKITQKGIYKGVIVNSETSTESLKQIIITQSKNQEFKSKDLGVYFKGSYAVISLNKNNNLKDIYIGEGEKLIYNNEVIITNSSKSFFKSYDKK